MNSDDKAHHIILFIVTFAPGLEIFNRVSCELNTSLVNKKAYAHILYSRSPQLHISTDLEIFDSCNGL